MKIHHHFGKALLIALISFIAISAASAKGRKFGLFVGINKYADGINQLNGCVNDAVKMREALTTKFGFKLADTTLLTDGNATRENI
ncbi:MAG: caspase family protein, partial [Pyrinomonadaceae bacterium]